MKFNLEQLFSTMSQPSTYAGLAGIAVAGGMADTKYVAVSGALATLFGIAAVVINEKPAAAVATVLQDGVEVASALAPANKAVVIAEAVEPAIAAGIQAATPAGTVIAGHVIS